MNLLTTESSSLFQSPEVSNSDKKKEYIDLSEFAEMYKDLPAFSFKDDVSQVDSSGYFDSSSSSLSASTVNKASSEGLPFSKALLDIPSDMDEWLKSLVFRTLQQRQSTPGKSDLSSELMVEPINLQDESSSFSCVNQHYTPDLSDILDESNSFWGSCSGDDLIVDSQKEESKTCSPTNSLYSISEGFGKVYNADVIPNIGFRDNTKKMEGNQKRASQKTGEFPCEASIFNIVDSKSEKFNNKYSCHDFPFIIEDTFSLKLNEDRHEDSNRNSNDNTGNEPLATYFLPEDDNIDIVLSTDETADNEIAISIENFSDCNSPDLYFLNENNEQLEKLDTFAPSAATFVQNFYNPDKHSGNKPQTNFIPIDSISPSSSTSKQLASQITSDITPNFISENVRYCSSLNESLNINTQNSPLKAVKESTNVSSSINSQPHSYVLFVPSGDNPETILYEATGNQYLNNSPTDCTHTTSQPISKAETPVIPTLLLITNTEVDNCFSIVNNGTKLELPTSFKGKSQTPITVTQNELKLLVPVETSNKELSNKSVAKVLPTANGHSNQKTPNTVKALESDALVSRNMNVKSGIFSNKSSLAIPNISCLPKTKLSPFDKSVKTLAPKPRKLSTPISVVPVSSYTNSPSVARSSVNSQIIFLTKLGTPTNNIANPTESAVLPTQSEIMKKKSKQAGQRQKTVKELLVEKRKRKILNCLTEEHSSHTDQSPSKKGICPVEQTTSDTLTCQKTQNTNPRPSILILESDHHDLMTPEELEQNSAISNMANPIESTMWSTEIETTTKNLEQAGYQQITVNELLQEKRQKHCPTQEHSSNTDQSLSKNTISPVKQVASDTSLACQNIHNTRPSIHVLESNNNNLISSEVLERNSAVSNSGTSTAVSCSIRNSKSVTFNYMDILDLQDADDPANSDAMPDSTSSLPFSGKLKSKKRNKHYDLFRLQIGQFVVEETEKIQTKFSVLFIKRCFCYEFPEPGTSDGERVIRIMLQFESVTAMNFFGEEILIKVHTKPEIFTGIRKPRGRIARCPALPSFSQYKLNEIKSQIDVCSIHKLVLRHQQAEKLKKSLCGFEEKFEFLMQCPVDEEIEFVIPDSPQLHMAEDMDRYPPKKRSKKENSVIVRQLAQFGVSEDELLLTHRVCACKVSCRSRCSCAKTSQKCNSGRSICLCNECDNPLNILDSIGIDLSRVVSDICLLNNIYKISPLRRYLCQQVKLPCCRSVATVQECIPGTVLCPNTDCMESIQYSWCREVVCGAERNPRNHCGICGRCRFSIGHHCELCNMCFMKKPNQPFCPNCTEYPTLDYVMQDINQEDL